MATEDPLQLRAYPSCRARAVFFCLPILDLECGIARHQRNCHQQGNEKQADTQREASIITMSTRQNRKKNDATRLEEA